MTLTEVINELANDILKTLERHGPSTQDEIYKNRGIEMRSYNGYAYGLDKLYRDNKIIYTDRCNEEGCIIIELKKDNQ